MSVAAAGCWLAAAATAAGAAPAAEYPTKPIRLLCSGVGGGGDFTSRLIGPHLAAKLGQPVVVDNRPGGVTPGQILVAAQADGHTLMLAGAVIWLSPFMRSSLPFDPVRDFAPVTLAVSSPNVLVVHPSLPAKSVPELIALARQKPGVLNVAASGIGNSNHLAGAIFKALTKVDIVEIAYRGAALALNDVVGGRVQMMFATANAARPHIDSGRIRALAVTSARPTQLLPGLPTVAASGVPGFESAATLGIFARTGTPPAVIDLLHRETTRFLKAPETSGRLFKAGIDVVASTPQEFAAMIRHEMEVKGRIIKAAGIRME
jgi:tripartite-type tricarboxylate transporter receptor subunit TctC